MDDRGPVDYREIDFNDWSQLGWMFGSMLFYGLAYAGYVIGGV